MVERLARIFTRPDDNGADSVPSRPEQGSILEHVRVRDGELAVCGEHVMAEAGPLHIETDFFGADEALTSHAPGRHDWVATLMVKGSDLQDARERRDQVIGEIRARFGLHGYRDDYPEEPARRVR
jgi:pyrrolysine biosynthesis protein PylC